MSIFGAGTSDFAPLSGDETIETGQFNDIEVYNNIYLKESTDPYTGYNVPLITTNKTNDDMIFNTTTLSSNFDFTVGTGEDTKESIFRINPTTGLHFETNNNAVNIDWNELSYLNGARSNIQAQIDNLDPDLSSNQGYWGNFWNGNTITNSSANAVNTVAFPSADANNYGFTISNSNRVVAGHAGIYMFIATIQINKSQGSTDEDVYFWIRQNGVDVADTAFKETIKAEPILATANWQLKMNAGDYFQLVWSSPDIHVQLVAYGAGTTPTKPAIPSVILTVSQVSFLVAGGAGLLPLTYNSGTKNLLCDASFQVVGNTDLSGNRALVRGNLDVSGTLTATGNALFSGTTFSYTKQSTALTVLNRNWTDGSGATPATNTKTTMFDVSNATIDVSGWRFSGTVASGSGISNWGAWWVNGTLTGFNDYGSPSAGNGPYYCIFYAYSSGTNQNNATFYIENRTPLSKGVYIANWQSRWNAGTNYPSTSLNVSVDGGTTTLLSYNDSATRDTGNYQPRTLIFEVKNDNSFLRWTFRDTQATANRLFAATIQGLTITRYTGLTVLDPTTNAIGYITPSVCQLNNLKMIGTNEISGTLSMVGLPSFLSNRGSLNVCLSSNFTQDTGSSISAKNIAIGDIGYFGQDYQSNILIGMNSMSDGSSTAKATSKQSVMISTDGAFTYQDDVVIGYGVKKGGTSGNCVLVGSSIGLNATSSQPFNRCVAVGSQIWRAYYFQSNNNAPQDNVAVGAFVQNHGDFIGGSYNVAVGSYSQTTVRGNINTQSYNTSVGYYSGADANTGTFNRYYGCSYFGALSKTRGTVANVRFATALGYNTIVDASYCTVIGADASYNVANTIRLGRPADTTIASHLTVNGNTTLTGNTTVGNLSITGTVSGLSFSSLALSGNLDVSGNTTLGNSNANFLKVNGNVINRGDGWSLYITSGNVRLDSGLNLLVDCGVEGGITYGVYDLVAYIKARDQVCYDRGTQGVNAAAAAQSTADGAAGTAAAAATAAAGAVAAGVANAAAIAATDATVAAQGAAISSLQTSMTTQQSKTQYMLPASTTFLRSEFYNKIAIYETATSLGYGVQLDPAGTSSFANDIDCSGTLGVKNISTNSGQVNNLRGSTVNIADSNGSTNIDCSFVSLGNVVGSSVSVGYETGNVNVNGGNITLGEGALYSTINLNGATYINGVLYVPFSNFTGYLNNRW